MADDHKREPNPGPSMSHDFHCTHNPCRCERPRGQGDNTMSDGLEPGEVQYGLVMPFVVVTSKGGPFDDKAFVAGCRYQAVAEVLRRDRPDKFEMTEYPELLPQLDLLAMHEGYTVTSEPWDEDPEGWAFVVFTKVPPNALPTTTANQSPSAAQQTAGEDR